MSFKLLNASFKEHRQWEVRVGIALESRVESSKGGVRRNGVRIQSQTVIMKKNASDSLDIILCLSFNSRI